MPRILGKDLLDMKKMRVFMAGMALAVLLAYSCRLPDSIEIGTNNLELSIPVRATVDIAELIRENLPEGLYDVRVFDMPNFASDISHGSPPQAFLIAIELDMLPSFNPGDYLDQIGGIDDMGDAAIDPIEADIVVPQIAWEAIEVSEYTPWRTRSTRIPCRRFPRLRRRCPFP